MIRYNFHGMNFVALLHANIFEDQLAILFYLPIVEYSVSILGHQHDVVGDLTIAMAETAQFQLLSHPSHRWVAPPVAKAPSTTSLQKEATFYQFKRAQRMGEGSLHPRPEGRGIRDPPHSRCNKRDESGRLPLRRVFPQFNTVWPCRCACLLTCRRPHRLRL